MQINDQTAQWLLKKSFAETTVSDWQNIADNYPAFNIAHLFLSKKQKESNNELFREQLPKTALRFSDPLWLNFLLTDITEIIPADAPETKEDDTIVPKEKAMEENRLASLLQAQAADFKKPVAENEQLPTETEPLYKTDYFASQGILYTKSQDALGKKVKKFTDWLKDIKKTNSGAPQLNTTEAEEKQAAAQATASLKIEEVLTEPMAEVLAQQGKKQQAIDLYKKLSLLYPEKSAYFAAKINLLQ